MFVKTPKTIFWLFWALLPKFGKTGFFLMKIQALSLYLRLLTLNYMENTEKTNEPVWENTDRLTSKGKNHSVYYWVLLHMHCLANLHSCVTTLSARWNTSLSETNTSEQVEPAHWEFSKRICMFTTSLSASLFYKVESKQRKPDKRLMAHKTANEPNSTVRSTAHKNISLRAYQMLERMSILNRLAKKNFVVSTWRSVLPGPKLLVNHQLFNHRWILTISFENWQTDIRQADRTELIETNSILKARVE